MKKTGDVELKLAKGPVPHYKELKELAKSIIQMLEFEFGTEEIIKRFANPLWYNSFACLLGFEWNYSGMTTVILKAIKESLNEIDTGLIALGGKGKDSKVIEELQRLDIKDSLKEKLEKASIFTAKVDNNLIQDGYNLYFHFILSDEKGNYTVINQKMNINEQKVRRFHWYNSEDFLNEENNGFGSKSKTLNISGEKNKEIRDCIIELLNEKSIDTIKSYIIRLKTGSKSILSYFDKDFKRFEIIYQELPSYLKIPERIYWKALKIAKNVEKFEDLLFIKGLGKGLLRSLVYVSSIIYGIEIDWKDPIIYTFAHGTKVGKPYYVKKELMLKEAEFIKNAIEEAKIGNKWKVRILRKLNEYFIKE